MAAWVALLRGVNVGGVTIRSADLRAVFEEWGAREVRTVLASGNVTFEHDALASARPRMKAGIERALKAAFDYDARIVLVTRAELRAASDGFPFDVGETARQPWVVFCVDEATRDELVQAAASFDVVVDPIAPGPGVVYWNPVTGTTVDTPFARLLAKAAYKPRTTNRNLRTLLRILG
jgi:uncharacterized protein (DUF1697 family)